ncbi:fascin domain-containing protein [Actinokineospora sp. HUAS TT18]|uniref:fascin domain-containing protein n=1 Tax=Actinokineospora sp. HUAS TT18 TaxID=3447451 RepID=UPI003F51E64C
MGFPWRRRTALTLATLAIGLSGVAAAPVASAAAEEPYCYKDMAIAPVAGPAFVSTELNYGGNRWAMLRASAPAIDTWETFWICYDYGASDWYFYATEAGYVSAELGFSGGYYGMLRARAGAIGPWEKFDIVCDNGVASIYSKANNRWVSVELGYSGGDHAMLRARATAIGPWEKFTIYKYTYPQANFC